MNGTWKVKSVYVVSVVGVLSAFGLMWYAGGIKGLWSGFALWVTLPYLLFALAARSAKTAWSVNPLLVLTLLSVAIGTFVYIDSMLIHLDAQGALVFVFVPLYQVLALVVVLAVVGLCNVAKRLTRGSAGV